MYLDYYGFKEEPFRVTPDPKYFYMSRQHLEVLSCLQYAIEYRKGFGILIGEAGSGKTTVGNVLLKSLDPSTKVAVITNTHLNERELIYTVLREFGEEVELEEKCVLLAKLNDFLIEELSRGGNPVLLIDEAQNLTPRVLEEVRMLANLETESEKLIQIIMMGQPPFEKMLKGEDLPQLQQRFSIGMRLGRLDLKETREYILFRTKMAGADGNKLFTEDAMDLIYEDSRGIPRIINNVCDACLINGYAVGKTHVDGDVARETVEERRELFGPEQFEVDVFARGHGRRTDKMLTIESSVEEKTQLQTGESDLFEKRARDSEMLKNLSRRADREKQTSRDRSKDDDELRMWLTKAFDIPNPDGFVESRGVAKCKKLKLTSMPSKQNMIRDLLMEYKPQGAKKSEECRAQVDVGFPANVLTKKARPREKSHLQTGTKFGRRRSASVPFVKGLYGIEV